jgi:hypothetical protein
MPRMLVSAFLLAVAIAAVTGCTSSTADTPDAAPVCACDGSGVTVHYDYGDSAASCPVFELGLYANFGTAIELTNDIQCSTAGPVSQGGSFAIPWPSDAQAGQAGTITIIVTGDGGMHGSGQATVSAAPGQCADVTIHLSCEREYPDAGGPDAGR